MTCDRVARCFLSDVDRNWCGLLAPHEVENFLSTSLPRIYPSEPFIVAKTYTLSSTVPALCLNRVSTSVSTAAFNCFVSKTGTALLRFLVSLSLWNYTTAAFQEVKDDWISCKSSGSLLVTWLIRILLTSPWRRRLNKINWASTLSARLLNAAQNAALIISFWMTVRLSACTYFRWHVNLETSVASGSSWGLFIFRFCRVRRALPDISSFQSASYNSMNACAWLLRASYSPSLAFSNALQYNGTVLQVMPNAYCKRRCCVTMTNTAIAC